MRPPATHRPGRAKPASDLEHLIMRRVGHAIGDYDLVAAGDRILVAVSGGPRSFAMLRILDLHRRRFSFTFELVPVFVDGGWDARVASQLARQFGRQGFDVRVAAADLGARVQARADGEKACVACCRAKKGFLHQIAREQKCNKLAFADLLDDFIEALLTNLFFGGQLRSLGVKQSSDGSHVQEIRPLVNVEAEKVDSFVSECGFEPVREECPHRPAGDGTGRAAVRELVASMRARYPRVERSLLAAMKHIRPTHLLDPALIEPD
jgi:tRNA 2-thiocytidine biosynthesis protein TtcA